MKLPYILLILIFIVHIFFRFYELEKRHQFSWDQVDNAWVAKDLIVDGKIPLLGMRVKLDSGFSIGPLYYYLVAFFYYLYGLDPKASAMLAGLTSIFTFLTLFIVTRKLFSFNVALIEVFIYSVSVHTIVADRIQWNVNFIVPLSLIIFYHLYKLLNGNKNSLLVLAFLLGISFHVHFTSVIYIIIVILCLPFVKWNKRDIKIVLLSIPLFLIWFLPMVIYEIQQNGGNTRNIFSYLQSNYHGIHLRRILQVSQDAFIQFESIFFFPILKPLKFLLLPLFVFVLLKDKFSKKNFIISSLAILWFTIPWFIFSTYKGEISDYYFLQTLPIGLFVISFLLYKIFKFKKNITPWIVIIALIFYGYSNIVEFINKKDMGLEYYKKKVLKDLEKHVTYQFLYGAPENYLYYYYIRDD